MTTARYRTGSTSPLEHPRGHAVEAAIDHQVSGLIEQVLWYVKDEGGLSRSRTMELIGECDHDAMVGIGLTLEQRGLSTGSMGWAPTTWTVTSAFEAAGLRTVEQALGGGWISDLGFKHVEEGGVGARAQKKRFARAGPRSFLPRRTLGPGARGLLMPPPSKNPTTP